MVQPCFAWTPRVTVGRSNRRSNHAENLEKSDDVILDVPTFDRYLALCLGLQGSDIVALFSLRLDETGTDGRSPIMVVAGAVATIDQWAALEASWNKLLSRSKINAYHWKEFNDVNNDVFGGWSLLKKQRFVAAQEKILNKNVMFRVAVGVDCATHLSVKKRMKGISGFDTNSDYSLALRWLMFYTCEHLVVADRDARLAVLVEDGPWSSGAASAYQKVAAMTNGPSAKHAHRLAGFASSPKGRRSLEAADYIAGTSLFKISNRNHNSKKKNQLSVLLGEPELESWYCGMLEVKKKRREHHDRVRKASILSKSEQSS